jgi:hypothetical protein
MEIPDKGEKILSILLWALTLHSRFASQNWHPAIGRVVRVLDLDPVLRS